MTNNLAQAIVRQPDRRVLIIDADLRCSRLHVPLGAPSSPGLTDYLRGEADEMAIIQHGQEGNLCFIPGGNRGDESERIAFERPPEDAARSRDACFRLGNSRFAAVLARGRRERSWPISCDGVLLVVARRLDADRKQRNGRLKSCEDGTWLEWYSTP